MKVLIVASYADSIYKFRGPLIEAMLDLGLGVVLVAPGLNQGTEWEEKLKRRGVHMLTFPLERTGTSVTKDLRALCYLCKVISKMKPDILLAYTVKPVIYGLLASKALGVSRRYALITGLGYAFTDERKGLVSSIVKALYRVAISYSTKVFFQNPDDEKLFRDSGLLSSRIPSVVVNGSGVETSYFRRVSSPQEVAFLLIARLLGDKGIREYVAAAREVRKKHPSVSFRLVGWIDENPDAIASDELDAWVEEGVIEYLGKLSDVRPAIEAASVYVLPSYREGTPRTVLEAMSMGRPIITTDAPGCRETVVEGVNGYLVPVQSVDALVEAMLRFIDAPSLIETMGAASRKIAEDKYNVHKVNAVMLAEMGI